jgi:hypothetical protein
MDVRCSQWRWIYSIWHKALCAYSVDFDISFVYQFIHGCLIVDFTLMILRNIGTSRPVYLHLSQEDTRLYRNSVHKPV